MGRTKQTQCGGKSHHPKGMATATFSGGTGAEPEEQFWDTPGEDTEDSQGYGDEATWEEGEASTSKSEGKKDNPAKQTKGGADAPPEETPPAPEPTNPKPGTSTDPTEAQPRLPPRTPSSQPSKTLMRKPHQTLLTMSKLTNRKAKYG